MLPNFLHEYFHWLGVKPDFKPPCLRSDVNPDTPETDASRMSPDSVISCADSIVKIRLNSSGC